VFGILLNVVIWPLFCMLFMMHAKVFSQLRQFPWSLAIGDIENNLDTLAASTDEISDLCTAKIKQLLQAGHNRTVLKDGIALLREVPWSTAGVEQSHGSCASSGRVTGRVTGAR
jgi:hypothetical protein